MTTANNVNRQPDLQSLYDKAAQDIQNGNATGAAQVTKQAAAAYAKQNPGSTVQDFEQAFAGAESGKVSSSAINNVVNQVLPTGDDPSSAPVSAIAAHGAGHHGGGGGGGGATATSTSTVYDAASNSYIPG